MAASVLLIDDDPDLLRAMGACFEELGYEVSRELSGEDGLATYDRLRPEVVVLDLQLPQREGPEVLEQLKQRNASIVLLTAPEEVAAAVQAVRTGTENFLTKPVDLQHLAASAARVVDKVRLRWLNERLLLDALPGEGLEALGESPLMREVAKRIGLVAQNDRTPVLIVGEAGTGKARMAALIHKLSPRGHAAYLGFHGLGLTLSTIDSELFGHERGALAGATERVRGLVEIAEGGSLHLDEVGDLPLELQPKLLRMLETRAFRRVGGAREIPADVRLLASSSRELAADIEAGRFREDLYYRLNVLELRIPPVRDRSREDRLALLLRLMNELQSQLPGSPASIGQEALERLLQYGWPGNVREMRNVLERALILGSGQPQLGVEHLPGEFRARPGPGDRRHTPQTIDELEKQHIERTLRHHGGNRTRAAEELAISRATLINKIKRYQITV